MRLALLAIVAACAGPSTFAVRAPTGSPLAGKRLAYVETGDHAGESSWQGPAHYIALYFARTNVGIVAYARDQPEYAQILAGRIAAVASPRGDAIAFSTDGGKTYRYVALGYATKAVPVNGVAIGDLAIATACMHVTATSPEELWRRWPDRRAFALDVLAHAAEHISEVDQRVEIPELAGLARLARADGDRDVLRAVVGAILVEDPRWTRALDEARDWEYALREILDADDGAVEVLVAALRGNKIELRGRAAIALSTTHAAAGQNAIAAAIVASRADSGGVSCDAREKLSWSLVQVIGNRSAKHLPAPDPVVHDAVIALIGHDTSCPLVAPALQLDAIAGLIALGDTDMLRQLAGDATTALPFDRRARERWNFNPPVFDLASAARGALDYMAKPN